MRLSLTLFVFVWAFAGAGYAQTLERVVVASYLSDDSKVSSSVYRMESSLGPQISISGYQQPDSVLVIGMTELSNIGIKLHPNPVQHDLKVTTSAEGIYTILDLSGQSILTGNLSGTNLISTSNLASGVYVFRFVTSAGSASSARFVKF